MKALTIHQPYATLLALKEKEYETRSWGTPYRGWIAIHAGKSTEVLEEIYDDLQLGKELGLEHMDEFTKCMRSAMLKHYPDGYKLSRFPRGAIVGIAQLADCIHMTDKFIARLTAQERLLGFYDPGRYAWKLANVQLFEEPVIERGKQGLWDWIPSVELERTVNESA